MTPQEYSALHRCYNGDCEPGSEEWCESLARIIEEMVNGNGTGSQKGLFTRYYENVSPGSSPYGPRPELTAAVDPSLIGPDGNPPWQYMGPNAKGTRMVPSWETHNEQFRSQQQDLANKMDDYRNNNCPDDDLPPNAEEWATRPAPTVQEWVDNHHELQRLIASDVPIQPVALPIPTSIGRSLLMSGGRSVAGWVGRLFGGGAAAVAH